MKKHKSLILTSSLLLAGIIATGTNFNVAKASGIGDASQPQEQTVENTNSGEGELLQNGDSNDTSNVDSGLTNSEPNNENPSGEQSSQGPAPEENDETTEDDQGIGESLEENNISPEVINTIPSKIEDYTLNHYFNSVEWLVRDGIVSISVDPVITSPIVTNVTQEHIDNAFKLLEASYSDDSRWNNRSQSIYDQYTCHVSFAGAEKTPWNLEPQRVVTDFWGMILSRCNPEIETQQSTPSSPEEKPQLEAPAYPPVYVPDEPIEDDSEGTPELPFIEEESNNDDSVAVDEEIEIPVILEIDPILPEVESEKEITEEVESEQNENIEEDFILEEGEDAEETESEDVKIENSDTEEKADENNPEENLNGNNQDSPETETIVSNNSPEEKGDSINAENEKVVTSVGSVLNSSNSTQQNNAKEIPQVKTSSPKEVSSEKEDTLPKTGLENGSPIAGLIGAIMVVLSLFTFKRARKK